MAASQPTAIYLTPRDQTVGAGLLAKAAWQLTQLDRVYIRYLGNGYLGFRSDSGSLLDGPKSNQKVLAPPLGTSPRLGVPVIRQRFGGPPPRAIHGAGRLNRHPCRFTPQIPVEFRPAWFNGALKIKIKSRSRATRFASWLPLSAAELCRYLWLSQASQLPQWSCMDHKISAWHISRRANCLQPSTLRQPVASAV